MNWLDRRLCIGRFASINLYLHWSLVLMFVYVVALSYHQGHTVVAMSLAQLVGMFFCVTLHEYGHAMAARRYGIGTADITLLAIGGIARLRSMPRIPMQELIVAIAGPAVNVVIATILSIIIFFVGPKWFEHIVQVLASAFANGGSDAAAAGHQSLVTLFENIGRPDLIGYLLVMLLVNIVLVLFNFIPAFPMDGGRVLRAILAMMMDYRRATYFASRVGWIAAAVMASYALTRPTPLLIPIAIAAFIVYAGSAEYNQVAMTERVRGITAGAAMIPMSEGISVNASVREVANQFVRHALRRLPLVGINGIVTGMITIDEVAKRVTDFGIDDAAAVGTWADRKSDIAPIEIDEKLEDVLPSLGRDPETIAVVNAAGSLVGMLDPTTATSRHRLRVASPPPFDQVV